MEIVVSDYLGSSPADRDTLATLITKGAMGAVVFATADLDGTFEKVRASGAEVMQEPMDQGWGARDCAFRDPAGNRCASPRPSPQRRTDHLHALGSVPAVLCSTRVKGESCSYS